MQKTCVLAFILALAFSSSAGAQRLPGADVLRSSTVFIRVETDSGEATGSGVVLTGNGVIATAAHVMSGAHEAKVRLPNGEEYDVVGTLDSDERLDVALISIAGFGLTPARLGNSDSVEAGDRLIAVGAPLGLQGTIADGLLSAVRLEKGKRLFQISIPVSPGSSGGPVATTDGKVVGLVVSGIRGGGAENLNFVVPINYVRGKLAMAAGKAPTPLSGARFSTSLSSDDRTGTSRRLNDSLKVDWSALDGVQYLDDVDGGNGVRALQSTRYSVTPNPDGGLSIERVFARRVRQKVAPLRSRDLADDLIRTIFNPGRENDFVTRTQRTPLASDVPGLDATFTARGSEWVLTETRKPDRRGHASPGILPPEFSAATITAYAGELPDKLSYWLLDPSSDRPILVKFEALRRESRKVPVATEVEGCSGSANTRDVDLPVVVAAVTMGVNRVEAAYLATKPHLLITDDLKCVRLP